MQELWSEVLSDLRRTLPTQTFSTWIAPLEPLRMEEDRFVLGVPNRFFIDWLRNNDLLDRIDETLSRVAGRRYTFDFEVQRKTPRAPGSADKFEKIEKHEEPKVEDWRERSLRIGLNPRYTFDTFVVGPCNEFAHAASQAVAGDSPRTYNPLFIYGGVGLGKTHLLNAIGNQKLVSRPKLKVCYVHSEQFMNELIQALANKKMPEFRNKYRSMDILLVDDIQFLAGRERTQEEFFHTFNALYESQKSIVVTSDKFPKDIPDLEDRLRSRFEWGLIADMQAPDTETKVAILRKKAEIESLYLPNDVSMFLASRVSSNIRELEGSLTRLSAFASLTRTEITLDLAKKVLRDSISNPVGDPTVDDVIKAVAAHYRLKITDIKGKRRTKAIAWARQVAMYLSRELTQSSFPEIGQKMGGKDHSTVMYACSKLAAEVKENPDVLQQVETLKTSLGK
jgi:chromosomal replication initiator protein